MTDRESILSAARPLVESGFSLHWLRPKKKSPVHTGWPTAPVATMQQLEADYRTDYNVGLRPGRHSKVCGYYAHWLDIDIRDPAKAPEAWAAIEALIPEAHELPTILSGSGGESRHLVLFAEKPFNSRTLARGKEKVVIDGRERADWEVALFGTGKQVAIPPSIHPETGKPYQWLRPIDFDLLDLGCGPIVSSERIESWGGVGDTPIEEFQPDDLLALVHQQPVNISENEIDDVLRWLPVEEWCDDRDHWRTVGMALHHQYEGADAGFDKWCEWSQQSGKYDHADQERVWRSFKGNSNPTTLRTLIKAAEEAKQKATDTLHDQIFQQQAEGIRAKPFQFIDPALLPRRQWLFGRCYIRQHTSALVAPGGAGKSALTIIEALSMVTGKPLLGERDAPHLGPLHVWMTNLEDPLEELQRRFAAACTHYGITEDDIGGRLFLDGSETEICVAVEEKSGVKIAEPIIEAIEREIREKGVDVVIVDPFVSSHAVSENDNSKIDRVVKTWGRIAQRNNCSIMLVHHVRKAGGGQTEYTADDARGASALVNGARSARVINRMTKDEAERFSIQNPRLYFRVDDGKANLSPPSDNAVWRRLVSVGLGNGSDWSQTDQDQVGVVVEWTPPDPVADLTEDDSLAVIEAVRAGEWRENSRSDQWVGGAFAQVLGWDLRAKEARADIAKLVKQWIGTGVLKVVEQKDQKRMERKFVVVNEAHEAFGRDTN